MALVAIPWLGALTGPFFGTTAGWCAFAALLSTAIPGALMARREDEPVLPALLAPFAFGLIVPVIFASMFATLARGGVAWRGRLYPLAELRARRVR
jgi:hypothetical protein